MYDGALTVSRKNPIALRSITIRGYRSISSIEKLELRPLNVLIGSNGSGKSNFLTAFDFVRAISEGKLQQVVDFEGGADRILHFGSKLTSRMLFQLEFEQKKPVYELELGLTATDSLYVKEERSGGRSLRRSKDLLSPTWLSPEVLSPPLDFAARLARSGRSAAERVRFELSTWQRYHFHDTSANSPLRRRSNVNDNRSLRPDGANLAAYLYFLKRSHDTEYQFIRGVVRRVAPFFEDFLLEPQRDDPSHVLLKWAHTKSDAYFDAASLSDGTLRFVALATLLLQPASLRPRLILVDEPELGLHPGAIDLLAAIMRQAAYGTQLIFATQSPRLLDQFEPEDVLVADRIDRGTQLTRLRPRRLGKWLRDYSLGQLWEKNELGGRPKPD